jgi:guanylate kinase
MRSSSPYFTEFQSVTLTETKIVLESAEIHGNLYGSSIKAVRDVALQGKTCLLEIDVQVISCFCTLI